MLCAFVSVSLCDQILDVIMLVPDSEPKFFIISLFLVISVLL